MRESNLGNVVRGRVPPILRATSGSCSASLSSFEQREETTGNVSAMQAKIMNKIPLGPLLLAQSSPHSSDFSYLSHPPLVIGLNLVHFQSGTLFSYFISPKQH